MKPFRRAISLAGLLAALLIGGWTAQAAGQEMAETTLEARFRRANEDYSEGRFRQALEQYRELITLAGPSAELYYNTGCAALKAGELGLAVANFHRAARLDPRDEDIRANLEFVRELTAAEGDAQQEENAVFAFLSRIAFGFATWEVSLLQVAFLLVFSLGAVMLSAGAFGRWRTAAWWLFAGGLLLLAVNSVVLGAHIYRYERTTEAVVAADDAEALSGPGKENTRVLVLPEGTLVRVRETRGDWSLVSLPSGRSGWLKKGTLEVI